MAGVQFATRVKVFLVFVLAVVVLLSVRLIDLQLLRGAQYRATADANRFFTKTLWPERGVILDRYGQPLVKNESLFSLIEKPNQLFSAVQPLSEADALQWLATDSARVETSYTRWYPFGSSLASVLGYAGRPTADELSSLNSRFAYNLIGKVGLEKMLNDRLLGQPGRSIMEVSARGLELRERSRQPARSGETLSTSLDPVVTRVAQQALGEASGAVVVLDAQTGQVLSLVSSPSYDPNVFSQTFETSLAQERDRQRQVLLTNPLSPLFNRAVAGAYPAGSVFKLMTAIAGLESGTLTESTTYTDDGAIKAGDSTFSNWYFTQYGRVEGQLTLRKAIARSNDIFFYKVAEAAGPEAIAVVARRYGLGAQSGIEISGEATGLVPDPAWRETTLKERWYLGNTYHLGIGQDELLVTPLQVAQMTQAIFNQGTLCAPRIVSQTRADCRGMGLSAAHRELLLQGMQDACSSGGTGVPFFGWNAQHPTIEQGGVVCKTGTAEFGPADGRGYRKTHGWFTMGVQLPSPVATPSAQIAASASAWSDWRRLTQQSALPRSVIITVLLESDPAHPYREGSRDAAPIAREILRWLVGE